MKQANRRAVIVRLPNMLRCGSHWDYLDILIIWSCVVFSREASYLSFRSLHLEELFTTVMCSTINLYKWDVEGLPSASEMWALGGGQMATRHNVIYSEAKHIGKQNIKSRHSLFSLYSINHEYFYCKPVRLYRSWYPVCYICVQSRRIFINS